jgi:hypothetical protein
MAVEKCLNRKIKKYVLCNNAPGMARLVFRISVVKPVSITVKKAVEKLLNRTIKKYVLCSNAPAMARL